METGEEHNGYATDETWTVCRWLENDEGSRSYWSEAAAEAKAAAAEYWMVREQILEPRKASVYFLANRLEEEMTEGTPRLGPSLYSDLLNLALLEVDWHEVAEAFLEEEFWSQPF